MKKKKNNISPYREEKTVAIVIELRVELMEAKKRIAELEKERDAALIRIAELEEDDGNDLFQPDGTWTHVRVD